MKTIVWSVIIGIMIGALSTYLWLGRIVVTGQVPRAIRYDRWTGQTWMFAQYPNQNWYWKRITTSEESGAFWASMDAAEIIRAKTSVFNTTDDGWEPMPSAPAKPTRGFEVLVPERNGFLNSDAIPAR